MLVYNSVNYVLMFICYLLNYRLLVTSESTPVKYLQHDCLNSWETVNFHHQGWQKQIFQTEWGKSTQSLIQKKKNLQKPEESWKSER